ncbi:MAG: sigma-70 family RNA polymerase sigma factor [Ignavibacteriales bacterium]|nr:sigma-70 family RNA polymerase sigma factor [Ignavibacteriales bacterium]
MNRYMKQAYYTALGFVGTHDDALDLSQEAFVRAYRAIGRFDVRKKFFTWYYRILRNLCLNALRDRKRREIPLGLTEDTGGGSSDGGEGAAALENKLDRDELHRKVWDALWKLDVEDRELIVARDILDTSYEMLAALMDCPVGTVMSRLYHARRRLKDVFTGRKA